MINRLLHSTPPPPIPIATLWVPTGMNLFYMQMSHRAVTSARRPCTQWQSNMVFTRTFHHTSSSSGTFWTVTGWWRLPFQSLGRPSRCQSPLAHPFWMHLERKMKRCLSLSSVWTKLEFIPRSGKASALKSNFRLATLRTEVKLYFSTYWHLRGTVFGSTFLKVAFFKPHQHIPITRQCLL